MTATFGVRAADRAVRGGPVAVVTADGHSWSWTELFDTFGPAIKSYARSRGVRTPDDVVQDVFVVAVEKLQHFEGGPSGLRSLLFTIAYSRIADQHRRFYRRPETLVSMYEPIPDTGPPVEDIVSTRDSTDRALQAFSVLNDRERTVLEMRIFQEAAPAQVAVALGVSSGNVRVIQARALGKIRKHLESVCNEGATRPIATGGMLFETIGYLRTELPSDGLLGQWIDDVRDAAANVAGASVAVASGIAAGTGAGAGAAAASTAGASIVASGAAKLTMLAVLVTTSAVGSAAAATGSEAPRVEQVVRVGDRATRQMPGAAAEPVALMEGAAGDLNEASSPLPTPTSPAPIEEVVMPVGVNPVSNQQILVDDLVGDLAEPVVGLIDGVVQTAVEDLGGPVLGAVVNDVVDPLVGTVVDDVVDPLVGTVVDDVVDPLVGTVVDDLIDPLVEDVVDPLVEEVLDPLVDDLVEDLELPPILGGLLGG